MSATAEQRLWRAIRDLDRTAPSIMRVQVASTNPLAVVGAEGDSQVRAISSYVPVRGEWVWLLRARGSSVIIGSDSIAVAPAARGQVTAYTAGSGVATVSVDSVDYVLPHLASYTPVVGHYVALSWTRTLTGWEGRIEGRQATPSTPTPLPESDLALQSTPAAAASGTLTIPAAQVGTWQLGRWRTDTAHVIQSGYGGSNLNRGYWFYDGGFGQLSGATVERAEIRLHAWTGGASGATPVRLAPHNAKTKGSGEPAYGAVISGAAPSLADREAKWWGSDALTGLVQSIVDGTHAGIAAISTSSSDYSRLCGLTESYRGAGDRDPLTGALRITWRR